ncbi:YdhR family protein [Phycicoccus sonneratiae]|uniref:YdhR family protein n=1 Tax=Phycicoccus sonneratiae TaxID=2807628 RepID=A0ABS2CMS6_9MICO|nr:YdhR family protein [Phycicoccus sonneraticus]MBM6400768.1 YdhR family protein [Phycicoccus sonneraticus]
MHAVVITFDLVDMSPEQYARVAAELAPSFEALPGLLTKVWLEDVEHARRGGFYLFADAASADGFLGSALARGVAENPHFAGLEARRFAVDETTTALTQPRVVVVSTPVGA